MRISKTTRWAVERALAVVNEKYEDNIEFHTFKQVNAKATIFQVRIKVKDSSKAGTKFSPWKTRKDGEPRRTSSACWHVHGEFHDALNEEAVIYSGGQKKSPGDRWEDINQGSNMFPRMMSYCCYCN